MYDPDLQTTTVVMDVTPGGDPHPMNLTAFKQRLFYSAYTSDKGRELWMYDPATKTTWVADIDPGSEDSSPNSFAVMGDQLYFSADDGVHGNELWVIHAVLVEPQIYLSILVR